MERSTSLRWIIGIGVLTGAAIVGVAWLALAGDEAPPPVAALPGATSTPLTAATTTSLVDTAIWFNDDEVQLGPAMLLPIGVEVEDGEVTFNFEIVPMAPYANQPDFVVTANPGNPQAVEIGDLPTVVPHTWTLITDDGEIPYRPISSHRESARFPVPAGFSADQIRGLRLDSYLVPIPITVPLEIPRDSSDTHPIVPGIGARVETLLEQGTGWLVVLEMESDSGAVIDDLTVEGVGVDWTRATGSMLGTPRWTMEYRAPDLPDPIPLEARGVHWAEIEMPINIEVEGLLR